MQYKQIAPLQIKSLNYALISYQYYTYEIIS